MRGFSLVEMSIVIVIIGLLVGGVVAGQSMLRASEINSAIKQVTQYSSATTNFRTKYDALPGDMRNATDYWGAAASCTAQTATGKATCNGNGDGRIFWGGTQNNRSEFFTFWQHLSNAELISGAFDGVRGPNGYMASTVPGTNMPATRINDGCINFARTDLCPSCVFSMNARNMFMVGKLYRNSSGHPDYCHDRIFTAKEAKNVDEKMDDGMPGLGKVKPWDRDRHANCTTSNTAATSRYNLTDKTVTCSLNVDYE